MVILICAQNKTGKINVFRNYETNKCGPHHITRTSGEMNTYLYNSVMDTLHVIKGKTILHQYHHCICNISKLQLNCLVNMFQCFVYTTFDITCTDVHIKNKLVWSSKSTFFSSKLTKT